MSEHAPKKRENLLSGLGNKKSIKILLLCTSELVSNHWFDKDSRKFSIMKLRVDFYHKTSMLFGFGAESESFGAFTFDE